MNEIADVLIEVLKVVVILGVLVTPVMYLIYRANRTRLDRSKAELLLELKSLRQLVQKQSERLANVEAIVTSPDYVSSQLAKPDFERLSDEDQAAELARLIAAREGRTTT